MVASGVIKDKSRNIFDLYDTDGDGVITWEDFSQRANRIVSQFGQAAPKKAQAVKEQYAHLWEELAAEADTDQDGQVTKEEFAAVLAAADPDAAAAATGDLAEFSLADTDDDGYLNLQETTRLLQGYGISASQADQLAAAVDKDGDGRISHQDYQSTLHEFYTTTDPDSAVVGLYARIRAL